MHQLVPNYTFSPGLSGTGTVTLPDFAGVGLVAEKVCMIVNVTRGTIIANLTNSAKTVSVAGNVITLKLDTSGMSGADRLAVIYDIGVYDPDYQDPTIVSGELQTFRDDFDTDPNGAGFNNTKWGLVPGTLAGAGASEGISAGKMTLISGTAANTKIGFRSIKGFRLPFRVQITHSISQRIANQSFVAQMTNAAGDTVASWVFDGVTATTAKVRSTKKTFAGVADTAVTVNSTAVNAVTIIDARIDGVDFSDKLPDGAAPDTVRAVRTQTTLIDTEDYFIEFFLLNGAVAPASSSTWNVQKIILQQMSKNTVEVAGGRGNVAVERAIGMYSVGGAYSLAAGNARLGFMANSGIWYDDTATALGAAAIYTGATRDLLATITGTTYAIATAYPEELDICAESDVAGTLYLEVSRDNVNWRRIKKVTLAQADATSVFYGEIIHTPSTRYARAVFVNGAAAQTHFFVQSMLMAA